MYMTDYALKLWPVSISYKYFVWKSLSNPGLSLSPFEYNKLLGLKYIPYHKHCVSLPHSCMTDYALKLWPVPIS